MKIRIMNQYLKLFLFVWAAALHCMQCGCTLLCPANITTFSTGAFERTYYKCEKSGEPAVLRSCPENQVYWPVKERCSSERLANTNSASNDENSDIKPFERPILGSTVFLGCLYNAKTNEIMAADSFWKRKTVEENRVVAPSYSQNIQFFAAQSTFDRLNHMDLNVGLKVEFLGGLISVEGSASFLRDSIDTEKTFAVIMRAHYTTRSEMLPSSIPIEHKELCKLQGPTHVVTSIGYGMDANFVFKKTVGKHESRKEIGGNLKVAVKSFPSVKIEGSGEAHITEKLKKIIENIDVKLFGDFVLDEQPTTYVESLKVFKTLPKHLGEKPDYANAAKMKMHLTPIKRFCDQTTAILISISEKLLHTVTEMLDKIELTKLRANTLLMSDSVNEYLPLKRIIDTFINKVSVFELDIKSELKKILPSIRSGGESSEANLVQLLTRYTQSPFNDLTSSNFLKIRTREIEMIDFILDPVKFKGTEVIPLDFEKASDDKILFTKPYVLMLKYSILPPMTIVEKFLDGNPVNESDSWFNDDKAMASMGEEFKAFLNFANANRNTEDHGFLLALHSSNKKHTNVYAQRKGEILSASFDIPKAPPKRIPVMNKYNAIHLSIARPSNEWVTSFIVTYYNMFRRGSVMEKQFHFDGFSPKTAILTDLQPNEIYQFNLKYVTVMGNSPSSPNSDPIVTRPCSPPTNLHQKNVTSSGFGIEWDLPLYIGKDVRIREYQITVRGKDFVRKMISSEQQLSIKGVSLASLYTVMVTAIVNPQKYNESTKPQGISSASLPAMLNVVTLPDPPSTLNLVEVSFYSAQVKWYEPAKIADGAFIKDYLVNYVILDNTGKESFRGTEMARSSNNKTSITLQDLVEGTTYGIRVKVLTSLGDSAFSSTLIIKTKFKETKLDTLRKSVKTELTSIMNEKIKTIDLTMKDLVAKEEQKRIDAVQAVEKECGRVIPYLDQENDKWGLARTMYQLEGNKRLNFIGYGWTAGYQEHRYSVTTSLSNCIGICLRLWNEDERWYGLQYYNGKHCSCFKGGYFGKMDSLANIYFKFRS